MSGEAGPLIIYIYTYIYHVFKNFFWDYEKSDLRADDIQGLRVLYEFTNNY
jgi:hypothetical protein